MSNIKNARNLQGIKQAELAESLNVTQATLSNWERGIHDPDSDSLVKMADILAVSVDYLLGRSDTLSPHDGIEKLATNNGDELSRRKQELINAIKLMDDSDVEILNGAADVIIARRNK